MGFFRRTETADHDDARTRGLLDAADTAFETDDSAFADVVMDGLMGDKATRPYPPAGHGYPRR
ncbi:hypothetical protein PV396_41900 [Streptomyces sp. ME02-8801-2C]|uniref:hypothetical protein n=1 Tax=Streptomyces sp. ME02-8801-2C TaxID=3028680 RepID=UPI0029A6582D|nr:hypothetical protein [Streptomyces sp. ME02-8801-2C]MDX3458419.1 hypothetical protein [Streptomyces sp. ME02-8801-2C]